MDREAIRILTNAPRPTRSISAAENREIDERLAEIESRAVRISDLVDYTDTIHPDRLLDIAGAIARGERAGPPPPPQPARPVRPAAVVRPVETRRDLGALAGTPEPDIYENGSGVQPMDLSNIFGRAASGFLSGDGYGLDDLLEDVVDYYIDDNGQQQPLPPPVIDSGPMRDRQRTTLTRSGIRCAPRRRRRRMLTKSDIADISTMAALLGRSSEAFKVWLAKATR